MLLNEPSHQLASMIPRGDAERRPLRIMTCIHSFDPGGVERVALRLNRAWRALGVDARIVAGRASAVMPNDAALNYEVIPGAERITRGTQLAWMLRRLPAIIRRDRPDILFCPGNTYSSVGVGMKLALGAACPPVLCKISNDLSRADMGRVLRLGYWRWLAIQGRYIDRFVAMAPAMVDEITARTGAAQSRIATINDPVLHDAELMRLAAIKRPPAPSGGRRFIAIGRLMPQKNFPLLLRAFARIATAQDRLTILGDGPERMALKQLGDALGLDGRLMMPGHVDDLEPWLADADVLVMSSDYEGVPAVVIEAIAANLPVIATRCSASMADLIAHGAFGVLVDTGDEQALADAMRAPPPPASPVAAQAHVRQFSVEQGAAEYLAVMQAMVLAPRG